MYTISNSFISMTVDGRARLTALQNLRTGKGNIISRPVSLFRAVLINGENWEDVAFAGDAHLCIAAQGNTMTVRADRLTTRMGTQEILLTLTLRLDGEKVRFGARIENRSDTIVNDFYYPCIGAIKTLGEGRPGLLYPNNYGEYHADIIDELSARQTWDGQCELTTPYPYTLSMQWMTLIDGEQCLYLAGHDSRFYASSLRAVGGEERDVTLEMGKMAYVEPGETWTCPEYVLWLYEGAWQQGADEYRDWATTWRRPVTPRRWMQDMNGYFLVINRQQFGDTLWPYEEIPALYDLAQEHGCDALGLFGWFESGHDNRYPDLEVSASMGGEELLREGIRTVQDRGGHVTLYVQGHLIDMETRFYRSGGQAMEGKSRWGTPYYEQYSKYAESDFLRFYSRKIFVTVCPWCRDWHALMAERAQWVRSFGADGILYDQIGGINPTPCFDKTHGHSKPSLSYTQGRLKLLPAIRESVDRHSGYAFMTETITDVYSQYIDCIHGIGSWSGAKAERADFLAHRHPAVFNAPEMFRHTFPETISTLRNARPYLDPRMANYALCYGFRFEVELRYLKDRQFVEENRHPEWKAYARAVCALRRKHASLLLNGRYRCDPSITRANPALLHGFFTDGDAACIVLWNDTDEAQPVHAGKYAVTRWETPDEEGEGMPKHVAPNSVVVLFC